MSLGRRGDEQQGEFWVATRQLPVSPGHVFYEKLNRLLAEAKFDEWVESLCEPYYARVGRPGIPPGVYFRMLLVPPTQKRRRPDFHGPTCLANARRSRRRQIHAINCAE
jgi:hypothetical protein